MSELEPIGQVTLPNGEVYTLHYGEHLGRNGAYFLGEKIPHKPFCDCRHVCYTRLIVNNRNPSVGLTDPESIKCRKDAGVPTE